MLEPTQKDYLTGFFLRQALNPFLDKLILDAKSTKKNFSIALMDLDNFKKFNDKYGHPFGDEILKYAASTLRLTFLEGECYLFRYGGDEFIAVFPDKDAKETFHLVRRCNYNMINRPFLFKNRFFRITVSCGIASYPDDAHTVEELIQRADKAMYFSKRYGHNLTTLASKMKYVKLRNVLVKSSIVFVVFIFLVIFYKYIFKDLVRNTVIGRIKNIKAVDSNKPKNLDIIILKNGAILKGRILKETKENVIFSLDLDRGEGSVIFKKSEVAKIKYKNPKTVSQ